MTPALGRHPARALGARGGRLGLSAVGASVTCLVVVGLLGPSVTQPPSGDRSWLPPWHLAIGPDPWLVTGLLVLAVVVSIAGLGLMLRALHAGWAPSQRRLSAGAVVAVVALVAVPPMGSADPLSYAAYGRIAVLGNDPYQAASSSFVGDPVAGAAQPPWSWAPSVYGPLATLEQSAVSRLAGADLHRTLLLLSLVNAVAFLGVGLLLTRLTRDARPLLMWSLNPLLLWLLVSGAHLDALAALPVAAAVVVLAGRRRPRGSAGLGTMALAGALLGAAISIKATTGLALLAALWWLRRRPALAATVAASALFVAGVAYLSAGPHVLAQLLRARRYVSLATPWHLIDRALDPFLAHDLVRTLIGAGVLALTLLLVLPTARLARSHRQPVMQAERSAGGRERTHVETATGAHEQISELLVVIAALGGAYLFAAAYALPWYDAALWLPLAALPVSRLHWLALAHTGLLSLAYLPGRVDLPADLDRVTLGFRQSVAPWLSLALLVIVLLSVRQERRRPTLRSVGG